jgi:hypothetical protein
MMMFVEDRHLGLFGGMLRALVGLFLFDKNRRDLDPAHRLLTINFLSMGILGIEEEFVTQVEYIVHLKLHVVGELFHAVLYFLGLPYFLLFHLMKLHLTLRLEEYLFPMIQ